jgi:hypothetical protein
MDEANRVARCSTNPACPRRWADGGPDRPCGGHADDGGEAELAARLAEDDAAMSAPGDRDGGDGGEEMAADGRHGHDHPA